MIHIRSRENGLSSLVKFMNFLVFSQQNIQIRAVVELIT